MVDDSFIREVDEQIRQDRAQELWAKYGYYVIALAVLIVVATGAYRGWEYYRESQVAAAGDAYMAAVDEFASGDRQAAIDALESVKENGFGEYPVLAEMRIAAGLAEGGHKATAIQRYDAIASDESYDPLFREIADLKAGLLAVDTEDYAAVEKRLSGLAETGRPFRHSAREALAIASIKAGNLQKAYEWLSPLAADSETPQGVRSRAQTMISYLAGRGIPSAG